MVRFPDLTGFPAFFPFNFAHLAFWAAAILALAAALIVLLPDAEDIDEPSKRSSSD